MEVNTDLKKFYGNKRAMTTGAAVVLAMLILVGGTVGVLMLYGDRILPNNNTPSPYNPYQTPGATIPPGTLYTGWAGSLYLSVVDKVGGAAFTTSTVTVDQVGAVNGVFNFLSGPAKSLTQSANPQSAARIWSEGDEIIVMADCTGNPANPGTGLDWYPAMYYMKLYAGAPIFELTSFNCFRVVSTSPYTYQIDTTYATQMPQTVTKYEASNVKYWNIGDLGIYPRCAAADFDMYLTYNGATLSSVTDGSSWDDTVAEINANATLASTNEQLTFQMVGATANHGWGREFYVVSSTGKVLQYGAVIIVTTAMTGIGSDALTSQDWQPITANNLYVEKGYFKVIEPSFPAKGSKASWTVQIPVNSAAATAATAYLFKFWLADCQNLADLPAVGTSTSVPTAYGFVTDYGVGAVVPNTALTFSSGLGATNQLEVYLTTPS
jgi:hypothetical protein